MPRRAGGGRVSAEEVGWMPHCSPVLAISATPQMTGHRPARERRSFRHTADITVPTRVGQGFLCGRIKFLWARRALGRDQDAQK